MKPQTKDCCLEWKPNLEKINGYIIHHFARTGEDNYSGKPFKYCPWCGKKRDENFNDV